MNRQYLEKVFSNERMSKYFDAHPGDEAKAHIQYLCNIEVSEAFYPCLSTLEVALRNAVNRELTAKFGTVEWYNHFSTTPGLGKLMKEISAAQHHITKRREIISPSKIIAELTLGFWVRLFNSEFERILWHDLRRAFPYLPKKQKKRKVVSGYLNRFRTFRNRVFHNEPICWKFAELERIHKDFIQLLAWVNKDLPTFVQPMDKFSVVISETKKKLL
ncbi:hypothetical protein [uncultured Imperialibacter sp.]|uniref:hypothetical protein n=1 Tax=uncultured Imperialibacter sp. TaxID=1672639 RepID=UPI0030D74AE3|tara:strand:+ start:40757 stop:41407 length:651 start_codon:yes stop_codon:yes gene_type:complete